MSEQLLLTAPEKDPAPAASAEGFDMSGLVRELEGTTKEGDEHKVEEPTRPQETPPQSEPGKGPGASDPGKGPGAGPGTGEEGSSAAFMVDLYDHGISRLSSALVDDPQMYPPQHFAMDPFLKGQATTQLQKGLQTANGAFNIPWYVALLIVMSFSGLMTWMAVRAAKKEKEAREAEDARRKRSQSFDPRSATIRTEPVQQPRTVTKADGTVITLKKKPRKTYGICNAPDCEKPIYRKGRKYCGQRCSGKASKGRKRSPVTPPAHVDDTHVHS